MDADVVHMVCRFVINTRNERTTNKLIEYPTQTEDLFESIVCNKSPSLSPLHLKLNSLLKVTGQGDSRRDEQTTVIIHRTCRLNYIIWIWGHSAMDGGWCWGCFCCWVPQKGNLLSKFASFIFVPIYGFIAFIDKNFT